VARVAHQLDVALVERRAGVADLNSMIGNDRARFAAALTTGAALADDRVAEMAPLAG
jgi:hypothetical protein